MQDIVIVAFEDIKRVNLSYIVQLLEIWVNKQILRTIIDLCLPEITIDQCIHWVQQKVK